ncbi:MAG: AIR synthase-related protein [Candidatus Thorarchaeota archaeon]
MDTLLSGKVPWKLLTELLGKMGSSSNKGVVQPAEPGIDVAVLALQEVFNQVNTIYETTSIPYLVYKADPITFPTPDPSKYLITVNMNDLATAGAIPYGITVTILLPPGTKKSVLRKTQSRLSEVCIENNITILGGHTEITNGASYPLLSASMIGFVPPEYYIPRKPQIGDAIVCSGWVAAEGTGILLAEGGRFLRDLGLTKSEYDQGESISQNLAITSRILECNKTHHESLHLVHDATEAGILGALYECLAPKGVGCEIESKMIPLASVTRKIADILGIDPYKLISSGAVLLVCDPDNVGEVLSTLRQGDQPAEVIGYITGKKHSLTIEGGPISPPSADHVIQGLEQLEKLRNTT